MFLAGDTRLRREGRHPMQLRRRTHFKRKPDKPLKGFILDISINVPERDIAFVHDQYAQSNPIPWDPTTVGELIQAEVDAHIAEQFGAVDTQATEPVAQ
jgi:hypothetical protein